MRHQFRAWGLAVSATFAVVATAHALPFDHLLGGKITGGSRLDSSAADPHPDAFTADVHADAVYQALDGTGCVISGPPKMMFVPATVDNVTPTPPYAVSSLTLNEGHTDRVFVCYALSCSRPNVFAVPTIDQLSRQFSLSMVRKHRLLCLPATYDATAHCGDLGDKQCGGPCEGQQQCMSDPDPDHHGACVCVDTPPCGQAGPQCAGNCPLPNFTCGSKRDAGRCECLPSCEASVDCEGFCSGKGVCWDVGPGCQCVVACGDVEGQCSIGVCPGTLTCQGSDGQCACQ